MTDAVSMMKMENAEIREEQLAFIRNKLASLTGTFLDSVQTQNHATQEMLCVLMSELESYIGSIFRRFAVNPDNDNYNAYSLDMEIEWIDVKAEVILKMLGKGKRRRAFF